jgi:hypothetical protein
MKYMSRRDRVLLFGLVVPLNTVLVTFVIGPAYLRPLPIWLKLVIVVAGCGLIGTIAVYSRRRARRLYSSRA